MNALERFYAVMNYQKPDYVPNWEIGVWPQTADRWRREGLDTENYHFDWFTGEEKLGLDPREYIPIDLDMRPFFEPVVLERTERYEIVRNNRGITTKALLEGTMDGVRTSMDEYISYPVETQADFNEMKKRYVSGQLTRYPVCWKEIMLPGWKNRSWPLILGRNCQTLGFYWKCRDWMGTENLSYAFYDDPDLVDDMMEFHCDFLIETLRPVLEEISPDYIFINEDMAMKSGPLLGPDTYRRFIFPRMRRLVDFVKSKGTSYVIVDSDGDTEPLLGLLMEAGVDGVWPIERASDDMDPIAIRKKYGRDLRLWGAVDKREIAAGPERIDAHLRSLRPLIEDGGFIPTVDHLVPPDVSLENFLYYMQQKNRLLRGEDF